jgi:hypothetical protein
MARAPNEAIDSYITDMIALEEHMEKPFRQQGEDLRDKQRELAGELRNIHGLITQHIATLKSLRDRRSAGGEKRAAESVKRATSTVAGLGAAVIDFLRTEKLPKDLRDDYTAMNLATIGYLMLHTTALALGDREVAEVAQHHFSDYARATMQLQNMIPTAVVSFLQEEGLPAQTQVLHEVNRTIEQAWSQHVEAGPRGAVPH